MSQPSAQEQYLLELVNRFRADPAGEYNRLVNSGDADIERALDYFDVDLTVLSSQWSSLRSAQPLAWSEQLATSADTHNQLMIDNDEQSHNFPGEPSLSNRINGAGLNSYTAVAENLYAYSESTFYAHAGLVIDWGDTPTGIQDPPSHRNSLISRILSNGTLLENPYREVGFSILAENDPTTEVGPLVVTQHLGDRDTGNQEWLLGVAYKDMDDDDFYSIGEGLGGLTVNITGIQGTSFSTSLQTSLSGGYQTLVPQGNYRVSFVDRGNLLQSFDVAVADASFKQDLEIEAGVPPAAGRGKIVGVQFDDINGNGVQDIGERGIAGRTVFLDQNGNRQRDSGEASRTTDADGVYIFNNLLAGNYAVTPILPAERMQTFPTPNAPLGNEDFQLDDGDHDKLSILSTNGEDVITFNQFEVQTGQEILTSISVGLSPDSTGYQGLNNPTKLLIYQDLDGDDRPDSNEKILEVAPSLIGQTGFANVTIAPTAVTGTFFVGALYEGTGTTTGNASYTVVPEDTSTPANKSWQAVTSNPNSFSAVASDSNWLLRANGSGLQAQVVSVEPDETVGGVNFSDRVQSGPIGEVGQTTNLSLLEQTITLQRTYTNPVVLVQPASSQDSDPVAVRLSNIGANQFSVRLQEPSNLTDNVHAGETLTYMVLESGTWNLDDGTKLEVGTFNQSDLIAQDKFKTVGFTQEFTEAPVVLSQVQTLNDTDFVRTRQRAVSANSIQIGMEEQQSTNGSAHGEEIIGYIAIESGAGTWGDIAYESGQGGDRFNQQWKTLNFQNSLSQPQLLASLSTYDGPDPAGIRYRNLSSGSVQLRVEEDTTVDAETAHTPEDIAYIALGGSGFLTGQPANIESTPETMAVTGKIQALDEETQTIVYGDVNGDGDIDIEFDDPVVIIAPASFNGGGAATPRLLSVTGHSFEVKLQEPDFLAVDQGGGINPGVHADETVHYMVVEAGTWQLSDGSILSADTVETNLVAENGFEQIIFDEAFAETPAVLSQVQTNNDNSFVTTRQRKLEADGFRVAMQEEQRNIGTGHGSETIGYVAFDPIAPLGSGTWDGRDYIVGRTGEQFDHAIDANNTLNFNGTFDQTPNLIAQIDTFSGPDASTLRYENLGIDSVQMRVHEDKTFDLEISHTSESISYFAIGGSGSLSATRLI